MSRIRLIADSACDIPYADEKRYGIKIMCVPITVDDKTFREHRDIETGEFWEILSAAGQIPKTAQITAFEFIEEYKVALEDGCEDVIVVTMNSKGSGTYANAVSAVNMFYDETPSARESMRITVIDSKTYTAVAGRPVICAAAMIEEGRSADEIVDYLRDMYDKSAAIFGVYTLKFAKKSGRITAAAAFVGEALGLCPIMCLKHGEITIVNKVRGSRNILTGIMAEIKKRRCPDTPYSVIWATEEEDGDKLGDMMTEEYGEKPSSKYKIGASVTINSGPRVVGISFMERAANPLR